MFGITTCLGRLCSCHFSPEGKGGDAMELPCVTHWAEPTTPNRGAEPGRNQRAKIYRENILLRADFLSYPVHCTLIWPLLALTGVAAAPQKPQCSSSPAVWDTRQKGSSGKVLAHGHTPSMLSACQEQDRGAQGGRKVAEHTASTVQTTTQPAAQPLAFRSRFKADPATCSAALPSC